MNQPPVESEYPLDALPEPLKSAAIAASRLHGVAPGMAAISLLASLATATQAEYNVESLGEGSKPLSLYVIVAAESGIRKSSVGKAAMRPHLTADGTLERRWRDAQRAHDEAAKDEKPPRPTPRRPLAVRMDATMETIPVSMSLGRPSFTQFLSESATFTGKWSGAKNQQLATMQNLNSIWDGEAHVVDRMNDGGRELYIPNGRLSVLWYGQPDVVFPWVLSEAGQNGFTARLLLYHDDQEAQPAPDLSDDERDQARADLAAFTKTLEKVRQRQDRGIEYQSDDDPTYKTMKMEPDAKRFLRAYYEACYDALKSAPNKHTSSFLVRSAENASRIAGSLAVLRSYQDEYEQSLSNNDAENVLPPKVTTDDIQAACQITTWHYGVLEKVSEALSVSKPTADRNELYELMVSALENPDSDFVHYTDNGDVQITLRRMAQQRRRFRNNLDALDKAIDMLEREGEITPARGVKGRWTYLGGG